MRSAKSIKQYLLGLSLLLMSTGLLSACNPDTADSEAPPSADTAASPQSLKLLYWQAPTTLNPHLSSGTKDREAASPVLEPLAVYNEAEALVPILAAEIPTVENGGISEDSTTVIWKLKEGVLWSDGEPFTAEDVVFTYDFITNPEAATTSTEFYGEVQNVEAVDDLTVKVTFKRPTPALMSPFVGGSGMILPEHIFKTITTLRLAPPRATLLRSAPMPIR
ncbi:MAG: ABC transporter substrate-binding protein [Phormidesmis sp.]